MENFENVEKQPADIKPCDSTSKRARTSMHSSTDQNNFTMPSTSNDQSNFTVPMSSNCHGSYDQNTFAESSTSVYNDILLRFDYDVNEYAIPALFQDMEKYLPGHRFAPTDEQLVTYYLRKKIANEHIPRCLIRDVNLYEHHPKELAERYPRHDSLVDEWYFFTPRERKYPNGSRPKRAAGNGYWKATGANKPLKVNDETYGFKQTLVFFEGKPPRGEKTNWIMHEYKVGKKGEKKSKGDMRLDDCVLCRIYYKNVDKPLDEEEVPSSNNVEDYMIDYDDEDIILQNSGSNFSTESFSLSADYLKNFFLTNGNFDGINLDQILFC